jgi:hypothetical protein
VNKGILNVLVILNTTLNQASIVNHCHVFHERESLIATQEVLLKAEITVNIASL